MKVAKKHICLVVTRICTILVMLGCVQTINAGTTEMTYDAAGNLLTKLTAELKKSISDKGCITYTYDHERVKEVLYPKNLFNRVTYTYGAPGDKYNRAGRIALIEDASGGEAYYYGRMGEVTKTVRTVMASTADIRTYVYGATYDSWNRVRTMTYPDGEVVTYHYDEAGQVESLTSNKLGKETTIVEQIGYDELGHTVYTKLGNGTETEYTYDDVRQRLQEMNLTASGNDIMRNKYQYDAVDNILGISNDVTPTSNTKLGGASSYSYQYDKLNRLISATGNAKDASYTLNMAYNVMSMPTSKVQTVDSTTTALSYNNRYRYDDEEHPTAPTLIGHEHYTYDANGNPTRVENDSTAAVREMYWDEENRLMVLSDNGKTSRYTYNHAGDRVVKSHGDLEGVYINGAPQGITFHEHDEFTLYPASIISVNKNRFTKHYFIGSQRIASRIGSGQFNNVYGRNGCYVTAGQQDYAERLNQIESQREEYYKDLGIAPGVPTMKGTYGDPENTGVGYNSIITELGDHSVPKNWAQYVVKRDKGETPGPPIIWSDPQDPEDAQPGYGFIADDTNEEETFFYHSDHLGSTNYITDDKGNITQYTAYLPYGELLVDEHSSSEDLPYKFNGKELDEETGLYYYGARYLNPTSSVWYGVDPLMEKYSNVSGYVYCFGNPINLIDEDGLFPKKLLKLHKTFFWQKDYYTFTQPMAHILSLVSGVNEQDIKKTRIYERGISNPYPWYFGKDTYGGITLPKGNDAAIIYTNNLFDDSELGQDYYAWLNISSHEVGHINHIKASNKIADKNYELLLRTSAYAQEMYVPSLDTYRTNSYIGKFASSYLKHGGHDGSPLEMQAEKGTKSFNRFNNFVNKKYGHNSLINLLKSEKSDMQKIQQIDKYWNEYVKSKNTTK